MPCLTYSLQLLHHQTPTLPHPGYLLERLHGGPRTSLVWRRPIPQTKPDTRTLRAARGEGARGCEETCRTATREATPRGPLEPKGPDYPTRDHRSKTTGVRNRLWDSGGNLRRPARLPEGAGRSPALLPRPSHSTDPSYQGSPSGLWPGLMATLRGQTRWS